MFTYLIINYTLIIDESIITTLLHPLVHQNNMLLYDTCQ